jgi:Ca-activated chloride channel homolog
MIFICLGGCGAELSAAPHALPSDAPVQPRLWCEQRGLDWATPAEPEALQVNAAMLGFASLDKRVIAEPIHAHLAEVRACYVRALDYDPKLAGRLVVRFDISVEGRVETIEVVEDGLADACVGRCVIAVARERWRWSGRPGDPAKGVTITYPFSFEPPG